MSAPIRSLRASSDLIVGGSILVAIVVIVAMFLWFGEADALVEIVKAVAAAYAAGPRR